MSHLSVFNNFWEPFFNMKMQYLMVSKKRIHYLCDDGLEKSAIHRDHPLSSLGKPLDAKTVIFETDFSIPHSHSWIFINSCNTYPTM